MSIQAKDWFDIKDPIHTLVNVELPLAARREYRRMAKDLLAYLADGRVANAANAAAKSLKVSGECEFTRAPVIEASGLLKLSAGDLRDLGEMLPQLREYDLGGSASGDFTFALASASVNTLTMRERMVSANSSRRKWASVPATSLRNSFGSTT